MSAASAPASAATSSSQKASKSKRKVSHRSTLSLQKTEVAINVYDLLPPGRLSSILWFVGSSLLHSGVVINGKEYAYGGHNRKGVSGVYWTTPKLEPPGGTWRCEELQGFSFLSEKEIEDVIYEASQKFQGTSYNLLTNNCNHFTSYLCEKLTSRQAPAWLNRAAGIGVALPCVVPREWIAPPDHETAEGELLADTDDEDDDGDDENVAILTAEQRRRDRGRGQEVLSHEDTDHASWSGISRSDAADERQPSLASFVMDTSGRALPASERAPT